MADPNYRYQPWPPERKQAASERAKAAWEERITRSELEECVALAYELIKREVAGSEVRKVLAEFGAPSVIGTATTDRPALAARFRQLLGRPSADSYSRAREHLTGRA